MTTKKKAVGVLFLGKDKTGELVAILQVRGKWNEEKNAPESWAGGCQATAHGGLEEGENFLQALLREVGEELGYEIVPIVKNLSDTGQLKELVNFDSPEIQVITYGTIVGEDVLKILMGKEKSPSFGGFKLIRQNEVNKIVDLKTFDKKIGVTEENIIAMFPSEKEAAKLAFKKFS